MVVDDYNLNYYKDGNLICAYNVVTTLTLVQESQWLDDSFIFIYHTGKCYACCPFLCNDIIFTSVDHALITSLIAKL